MAKNTKTGTKEVKVAKNTSSIKQELAAVSDTVDKENWFREFAKTLKKQIIHDPTGSQSRRKSRTFSGYTKETLESYLKSPTDNEKNLRDASIYLYQTCSRYRNLLNYFADIPCYYYTINASGFDYENKPDASAFSKQYKKVCQIVDSINLKRNMREVNLVALREGVFFGVIWGGDGKSFILQKLNPDYCTITGVSDGGIFTFDYDMSKINEGDLEGYYPPEFKTMYNAYQAGGTQYQPVPSDIAFCIKADPTVPEYSIPPFSSVLPTLVSIKAIEDLHETASELQNYKLLAAKIPTDQTGAPLMDQKTAMAYYNHIANNLSEMIGLCISPFEMKEYDFQQNGAVSQIDAVSQATQNFFEAAGTSAVLHGTVNQTSAVTKLAIKSDEAYSFSYLNQDEALINRFLKQLSGSIKFKVTFLPVSVFNKDEMMDKYKNSLNYGLGKIEYLACLDIPQETISAKAYLEKDILDFNNLFKPLKTASTQSADDSDAGRPQSDDGQISDAGEATRDGETNNDR